MQTAEAITATYLPEASTAQLRDFCGRLQAAHAELKAAGRELDLTRGKPATEQVALSDALLTAVTGRADCLAEDGTDCTNYYGNPQGLIETRRLFAPIMGAPPEQILIGNSSASASRSPSRGRSSSARLAVQRMIDLPPPERAPSGFEVALRVRRPDQRQAGRLCHSLKANGCGSSVLPIAFAVVRLTTSSNLLGCSTGMSAALAPCNILSTGFYGAAPQRPSLLGACDHNGPPECHDNRNLTCRPELNGGGLR